MTGVAAGLAFRPKFELLIELIWMEPEFQLRIFTVGKRDWSCGERRMSQDHIPLQVFMFATVLLAAFFGSIAVALSWLG